MIVLDENTRLVLAPELESMENGADKLALLDGNLVFVNRLDQGKSAPHLQLLTAMARLDVEGAGTVGHLIFRGGLGEVVLHPGYDGTVGSIRIESQGNVLLLDHPFSSASFGNGIAGISFSTDTGADLSFASWLPFFQITAAGSTGDETPTDAVIDVTGDIKAESTIGGEIVATASDTPPGPSPAQFIAETTRDDEMVADEISAPVPADIFILPTMPNDFAQFTDQTPGGVGTLAAALLGGLPDLPIVSNSVIFVGDLDPSAAFFGGIDLGTVDGIPFILGNGVLITSGEAPPGFNNNVSDFTFPAGLVGDGDLDALLVENGLPGDTTDSTSLTFTVKATSETHAILFAFVFATEEFPEEIAGDIAGIFVDGENYLFFPDGALVRYDSENSDRNLVDNTQNLNGGVSPLLTEYDAVSRPAIVAALFDPDETSHTIRVAISDTGDQVRDSGLFLATLGIIGNDTLGGQGNDTLAGSNADDTVIGGAGADLIFGLGANDSLDGGDGEDTLDGGVDDDNLSGGAGDDILNGGLGADVLNGGLGNDLLTGGAGNDVLDGASGVDSAEYATATAGVFADLTQSMAVGNVSVGADLLIEIENVLGSAHDDTITGDELSNLLDGASGGDLLDGGAGNDTLLGGGGDDTFIGGLGSNELSGGTGNDTADYTAATAAVLADLSAGMATVGVAVDALAEIENLVGSDFADELTGDGANNLLEGAAGDDTLGGGSGNDTLDGGEGFDIADYRSSGSAVMASLTLGAAVLALESDTLGDIEALFGSNHSDVLSGDGNANLIEGNGGDDTVDGGGGADTLDGGEGVDTVTFAAASQSVTAFLATQSVLSGGASISVSRFENLEGSVFADVLFGDGLANSLLGLAGNDFISGGAGADIVEGGTSNDMLDGGAGSDVLSGGGGNDTASFGAAVSASLETGVAVDGSGGVDVLTAIENLTGSNFDDELVGDVGANSLLGLDGDDSLNGGDGEDSLAGGNGADTLDGGEGVDTASFSGASEGVDSSLLDATASTLAGNGDTDTLLSIENLLGSDFADRLAGDANDNHLNGGAGDDTLDGGVGRDTLIGGAGADEFLLFDLSDPGGPAPDIISDFSTGADRLLTDFPVGGLLTERGFVFDTGVLTKKSFSAIDEAYDGTNGTSKSYNANPTSATRGSRRC